MDNWTRKASTSLAVAKKYSSSVRPFCRRLIMILAAISLLGSSVSGAPLCSTSFSDAHQRILPSKRLENSSPETKKLWESLEKIYKARVQHYLIKSAGKYQEAREKKHPHILFLEKLGFDLRLQTAPPLFEVLERIKSKIWEKIDSGKILPEDAIWPILTLRLRNNEPAKIVIDGDVHRTIKHKHTETEISYGEEPKTLPPWRIKVAKKSAFQSYKDFAQMLANNKIPIAMVESANGPSRGDGISALQHDLAHLDVLLEYPRFAASMKNHYVRALAEGKTASDDVKFQARKFLAFESSFVVGPKNAKQLEASLRIPDGLLSKVDYIDHLKNYFGTLSKDQLIETANHIKAKEYHLLVPIGAAIRDVVSQFEFSTLHQFPSKAAFRDFEAAFKHGNLSSREVMIEALTKLTVFLKTFQTITPENWIDAIIVDRGQTSKLKSVVDDYDRQYPNSAETKIFRVYFE